MVRSLLNDGTRLLTGDRHRITALCGRLRDLILKHSQRLVGQSFQAAITPLETSADSGLGKAIM
jgi:hypothetical protein